MLARSAERVRKGRTEEAAPSSPGEKVGAEETARVVALELLAEWVELVGWFRNSARLLPPSAEATERMAAQLWVEVERRKRAAEKVGRELFVARLGGECREGLSPLSIRYARRLVYPPGSLQELLGFMLLDGVGREAKLCAVYYFLIDLVSLIPDGEEEEKLAAVGICDAFATRWLRPLSSRGFHPLFVQAHWKLDSGNLSAAVRYFEEAKMQGCPPTDIPDLSEELSQRKWGLEWVLERVERGGKSARTVELSGGGRGLGLMAPAEEGALRKALDGRGGWVGFVECVSGAAMSVL